MMHMKNVFECLQRFGHDEDFRPHVDRRFKPTDAPVGSKEKIDVLARRARLGLPLWHPEDRSGSSLPDEICGRFLREVFLPEPFGSDEDDGLERDGLCPSYLSDEDESESEA